MYYAVLLALSFRHYKLLKRTSLKAPILVGNLLYSAPKFSPRPSAFLVDLCLRLSFPIRTRLFFIPPLFG